jgi:hypothetical protein
MLISFDSLPYNVKWEEPLKLSIHTSLLLRSLVRRVFTHASALTHRASSEWIILSFLLANQETGLEARERPF